MKSRTYCAPTAMMTIMATRNTSGIMGGLLVSRVRNSVTNLPERGARPARRDDREYLAYLKATPPDGMSVPARPSQAPLVEARPAWYRLPRPAWGDTMLRVKSFLIPLFFHVLLLGVIPWWITGGFYVRPGSLGLLMIPGSLLGLAGILLIVRTALLFADVGQGTPSPFHPPGKLVVKGPFRWMRHPLYAGVLLIAFGEALATVSSKLLIYAGSL